MVMMVLTCWELREYLTAEQQLQKLEEAFNKMQILLLEEICAIGDGMKRNEHLVRSGSQEARSVFCYGGRQ